MLNRLFSFGLVLIVLAAWTRHAEGSYEHDKVVRLEPLTDAHIDYLRALEDTTLDFWTEIIGVNKPVDVHIPANEYDQYISQFKQYSLPFEVLVDDLQIVIDKERDELLQDQFMRQMRSRLLGQARADIVGTYASYADMVTFLKEKAAADPSRVEVIVIGNTFENRQIQAAVLKYNPSAKKNVWIDCGIHAREWITPATCIWIVDKLIEEYNTDATVRDLLDYWNVYVAPSLNPDGYEFSRTGSNRLWRKSRSNYGTSTCYGVDLNRNYPWKWMTGGASTSACSDTYGGRSAGSEIETISVVNFMQSKIGTWDMYMSFHSYGQWWFTPYGYTTDLPANYTELMRVAQVGANAIKVVNQRDYTLGTVSRLLYIASGSTTDWAYDALKIMFSYTIELPPTQRESSTGFVLPPAQAPGVCRETYAGMKAFMAEVKKAVLATSSG